jgi:hypothetical protein
MPIDMQSLARVGAQRRIAELMVEVDQLRSAFPDLDSGPGQRGRGRSQAAAESDGNDGADQTRRRKAMSPAQKRAVGQRMKTYWANRRSASGTASSDAREPAAQAAPAKRVMSAEAREKIAAAQRKRWRAVKRAAKKR